jgi:hypothetical protein
VRWSAGVLFQRVTGPKFDTWLVKTVGALVTIIGGGRLLGAERHRLTAEMASLATGSALALAAVDTFYATTGRISKICLLDALAEVVAIAALAAAATRARQVLPPGPRDA